MDGFPRPGLAVSRFARGPVGARPGRRARDHDVAPADSWRTVGRVPGHRVLEVARVVARRTAGVQALARPARFEARPGGMRHRFRHVELEAELDGGQPLRVPGARAILKREAREALLEPGQGDARLLDAGAGAVDAAALLHGERHRVAHRGELLAAARAFDELQGVAARLLGLKAKPR